MNIKTFILYIILIFPFVGKSNMASPINWGTNSSTLINSKNLDVLSESMVMNIDSSFSTCQYHIEYIIQSDSIGSNLPLGFIAYDFEGEFKVFIDDQSVEFSICDTCGYLDYPYLDFTDTTITDWSEHDQIYSNNSEILYYLIPITKKQHKITVEYKAVAWEDRTDWIKEITFRYSLAPAKHWKSFRNLSLTINAPFSSDEFSCNLGEPNHTNQNQFLWEFNKLPGDELIIKYNTSMPFMAKLLIVISPMGLCIIYLILSLIFQVWFIKRKKSGKIFTWILAFILTFISLFVYMFSFGLIDLIIGDTASVYHGYTFFIILAYPIILIIYLFLLWAIKPSKT